jgi:hypothetical protein
MRAPVLMLVLAALALVAHPAAAQFPTVMNYQVMLTDDLDEPLADQSVELVFRLYEIESGGVAEWTETHNTTTNSIGVVSVVLGSNNPIPFAEWPGLFWLEVEVDGEVMSPRRRLTSSPYAFYSHNSTNLGGNPSSYYATHTELETPGTLNNPSNPVDWTKLKSVPSGFSDGTDDVGGAGDGHSLDAWDGDPVDALWVAGNGYVGIGTTDPVSTMHVHKDTIYPASLRLTTIDSGAEGTDGFVISLDPFGGSVVMKNHEALPIYIGSGTTTALKVNSDASVDIAPSGGTTGEFNVYGASMGFPLHSSFSDEDGGQFELKDEAGNVALMFGADDAGSGGRLLVQKDDTFHFDEGIDLNGSWSIYGEPALRVKGSSRSAQFFMHNEGNNSVQLPSDAIYDYEILDEPGVASEASNVGYILLDGVLPVTSQSITTPSSGYVLVIATCQASVGHTSGSYTNIDLGVSDSDSEFPANQDVSIYYSSGVPSGSYHSPVTVTGLFEVASAGTYTYYLLGYRWSGEATIYDMQLTLVFLPTAYGTVAPIVARGAGSGHDEDAGTRGPITEAEVAAQRA